MKIILLSLSLQSNSLNHQLIAIANKKLKSMFPNVEFEELDLNEFDMPAFKQNSPDDFPPNVTKLANKINPADGLIISSPEYNFSFPGHFKNTFDWLSRLRPMPWHGKHVFLMSASPSLVGGNRGLWQLRVPFEACGSFVHPDMFSLAAAHEAFHSDGSLKNEELDKRLQHNLKLFMDILLKLKA